MNQEPNPITNLCKKIQDNEVIISKLQSDLEIITVDIDKSEDYLKLILSEASIEELNKVYTKKYLNHRLIKNHKKFRDVLSDVRYPKSGKRFYSTSLLSQPKLGWAIGERCSKYLNGIRNMSIYSQSLVADNLMKIIYSDNNLNNIKTNIENYLISQQNVLFT